MSRVVYTEFQSTSDQEALRQTHQVRIVAGDEEGTGVNALPGGVYGFTYSPGLASAPLFSVRRYRSYETHKLPSGEIYIIGVADSERGRGLGRALVLAGLNEFSRRGVSRVGLKVDEENPTGARELYASVGFRVAAREEL